MISDRLRIVHILDSAAQLAEIVSHPKGEALSVRANRDSLCYNFILIGEASSMISDEFKAAHPEVPWAIMRQMRNILVHEYMQTNMDIVWNTATKDVPELVRQLTKLLSSLPAESSNP
jgi:uncharacterized protein with HEPN domain